MKLVIVESPTKAKTIGRFLGKEYAVTSSYGHIRDLPKSKLGVDIEKGFTPQYVIPTKVRKRVGELKKEAAKAEGIILATDEDREGEAIAWHITQALGLGNSDDGPPEPEHTSSPEANLPKAKKTKAQKPKLVERIVFHEITERAIEEALQHPREIMMPLVDAQQTRRILDRLVGYNLSPFLWKKVARGLSAGRVQSVAVRLIVEREREREAFKPQEYWTIEADIVKRSENNVFRATLAAEDSTTLEKFALAGSDAAERVLADLKDASWAVESVDEKERSVNPSSPFRTSTLQQEAWRRLRFSAKQTMRLAQQLYEGIEIDGESVGLITYMRTDSLNLSEDFLNATQQYLARELGDAYATGAKRYKTKARGAQEAHEAIRPTDPTKMPDMLKGKLEARAWKLYDLIWRRAIASQMPAAKYRTTSVAILAKGTGHQWTFKATGSIETFDGFARVWHVNREDALLPALAKGDALECRELFPIQHFTEPPPRFSEASLVKALEELGIGRPSTYAPIISTIQDRGYVEKDDAKRLEPTKMGFLVNDLLVEHFPEVVDLAFTAKMEGELDQIAEGNREWKSVLKDFWTPFAPHLEKKLETVGSTKPEAVETGEVCEKCGKPMVQKFGRFGPFMACSGFPECRNAKPLKENRTGITCPKCNKGEVIPRRSKRGRRFFGCDQYPNCDFVSWDQPINEKCPQCQSLLTKTPRGLIKCPNKECDYKRSAESEDSE